MLEYHKSSLKGLSFSIHQERVIILNSKMCVPSKMKQMILIQMNSNQFSPIAFCKYTTNSSDLINPMA